MKQMSKVCYINFYFYLRNLFFILLFSNNLFISSNTLATINKIEDINVNIDISNIKEDKIKIICFGDSTTQGYYDHSITPSSKLHPYTIKLNYLFKENNLPYIALTYGHAGKLTYEQPSLFESDIKKEKFNIAIIWSGSIDVISGSLSAEDIADNIIKVHNYALKNGMITLALSIVQCELFSINKEKNDMREKINKILYDYSNKVNKDKNNNKDKVIFVDMDRFYKWSTESYKDRDLISDGGIHYTKFGYDKLGEFIFNNICKKLLKLRGNFHLTIKPKNKHITLYHNEG